MPACDQLMSKTGTVEIQVAIYVYAHKEYLKKYAEDQRHRERDKSASISFER